MNRFVMLLALTVAMTWAAAADAQCSCGHTSYYYPSTAYYAPAYYGGYSSYYAPAYYGGYTSYYAPGYYYPRRSYGYWGW